MLLVQKLPRLIRFIVSVSLFFLAAMFLWRVAFFISYKPTNTPISGSAFSMGLRYDVKFVCILAITILVTCVIPFINPFKNSKAKKPWVSLLIIIFSLLMLFYVIDFYYYDYLQQRLTASILSYSNDAKISLSLVWQSYPVIKISLFIITCKVAAWYYFNWLITTYQSKNIVDNKKGIVKYILFFLLLALGIFGKIGQFNLRWSDAFTLNNNFKATLALNPLQSFFSTLKYKDIKPDENKVRSSYTLMAELLGVQKPDSTNLNFKRVYDYRNNTSQQKPNIVVIICESFSMYKSSMSGNPLNTTPFFKRLCDSGVFFNRCFTPSYPTARGVWATLTSLPDVLADNNRTASRNPELVNQHVIMNDFKGYEKFYFLGGDPTWANIKAVFTNNVDSIQLYNQENFSAKKVDVWGIDDKNLFLEANTILSKQQKPFFAIIQTADNHRPYTIPESDLQEFKKANISKDSLDKYGFSSIEELNAFRYTDFCFQKFITAASKQKYFKNTIFVFVGDHGIPGNATAIYPKVWTDMSLSYHHVPLLFYSPTFLKPQLYENICSQVDIMPSVACLANLPYTNTSLGKNLFDSTFRNKNYAFIIDHEKKTIGIVNNEYYYTKNLATDNTDISYIINNNTITSSTKMDTIKNRLNTLTEAYYQTAKYLLYNNKK